MIIKVNPESHFSFHNIPFGAAKDSTGRVSIYSRIGDFVISLLEAAMAGLFEGTCFGSQTAVTVFSQPCLNNFMALGRPAWRDARSRIQALISGTAFDTAKLNPIFDRIFVPADAVQMVLPVSVGDYTDFYASKEHASNVGTMFRGKDNALMPNWTRMPIGYHGRASSIVVSGTPVRRPSGQVKPLDQEDPVFTASKKLDIELEMGFVIGVGNDLGSPIPIEKADEHIFGVVILNDWSARDIQAWEYVPLGPFLGKNFCTTISPWIVTLDALEPFLVNGPKMDHPILPYLQDPNDKSAYDINLQVFLKEGGSSSGEESLVCESNLKYMYWSARQQLAHHTVNGCNMRPGDICGTGTISGPTKDSFGSMLELSWNGKEPISLKSGAQRTFLEDGDQVIMRAFAKGNEPGFVVGFGDCTGQIMPAA